MYYRKIMVSEDELLNIHHSGYRNRYVPPHHTNNKVLEVFELNQPPTIYLNKENTAIENLYCMTHCMGHIEFQQKNRLLKHMKVPQMTNEVLLPYIQFEDFDLFINVFRQLSMTTQSLNSRFLSPINYFLLKVEWFYDWQMWLLKLIKEEAIYFGAIKKTKLMNEGFAVHLQREVLKDITLSASDKIELVQLDVLLHEKPEYGLNYYSLGKTMWSELSEKDQESVMKEYDDVHFILNYYTATVHEKEKISVVVKNEVKNDFKSVKHNLIQYFKNLTPNIYVDLDVTNETGYLTLRYQCSPYNIRVDNLKKIKYALEQILNQSIYLKPLEEKHKLVTKS